MEKWQETLSDMLQEELRKQEMSQRDLAKLVGVSHATVNRWIKGEVIPDTASQIKLAKFFGLPETPLAKLIQGRMQERQLLVDQITYRLGALSDDDLRFAKRMLETLMGEYGVDGTETTAAENSAGNTSGHDAGAE